MYEPLIQRVSHDVVVILQNVVSGLPCDEAVRMRVIAALGEEEVTAISVQQIAYAAMLGVVSGGRGIGPADRGCREEASAGVWKA
jgi:hypothetical protein